MNRIAWVRVLGVFVAIVVLSAAVGGVYHYLRHYRPPMREAEAIVQLLRQGTDESVAQACRTIRGFRWEVDQLVPIAGHQPLRGAAAKRVHAEVLRALPTARTREQLHLLLFTIGWCLREPPRIHELSEEEWGIISAAVDRYNKTVGPGSVYRWGIVTGPDGKRGLWPQVTIY